MKKIKSSSPDVLVLHGLQTTDEFRSSRIKLLAIVLGTCIAAVFLCLNFLGKKTNFEDASTFGAGTSSVMASVDGHRIHCSDSRDANECIAGVKSRDAKHSVLWLGNSQVHAVNQLKEGETNAVPLLFDRLKISDLDLVTLSQPNANLQEHLAIFEYMKHQIPIKVLILPLVFDDARENGLRKEVADFAEEPQTRTALSGTAIGSKILRSNVTTPTESGGDTAGISHTLQERVERILNTWLEERSELWAARPEIRGQIMTSLYLWRNTVFGIKPSSKRKVIRSRYQDNISALEAILASATRQGIAVVLYVAPLRSDVETPYVNSEYKQFKTDVQVLADRFGATFANLEDILPAELWGTKDSTSSGAEQELDFMHFQAGGHKLLAAHLAELVTSTWAKRGLRQ